MSTFKAWLLLLLTAAILAIVVVGVSAGGDPPRKIEASLNLAQVKAFLGKPTRIVAARGGRCELYLHFLRPGPVFGPGEWAIAFCHYVKGAP